MPVTRSIRLFTPSRRATRSGIGKKSSARLSPREDDVTISYTTSATETFTIVHARYLASKVATDLKRFQRFYGSPPDAWIASYEAELVQLLKYDVLGSVVYGFQRHGQWTAASVQYTALPDGSLAADDDPGKIRPGLDVGGAAFTSFLTYSAKWNRLSAIERA